ncbi:MAG: hypothetical protein U0031_00115 [Thermomicrobiales bacterium]
MSDAAPETRTIDLATSDAQLSDLVRQVSRQGGRILILDAGGVIAALISAADLERLVHDEGVQARRRQALKTIGGAFADVPLEELDVQITRIMTEGPQVDEPASPRKLA